MTDRRETHRKRKPSRPAQKPKRGLAAQPGWDEGERIAKYLARAGIASRRDAEAMIERREVRVDGRVLTSPAFKVTGREDIRVRGKRVRAPEPVRLWRYHKPAGLITTTRDPEGRRTIFDELPKSLPRVITVGRLDLTTEGLLLLTNSGELARAMELPDTGFRRVYRTRAHGKVDPERLAALADGLELEDGTRFSSIEAVVERETGTNSWLTVTLTEGKNREVRRALDHIGLQVNRLIRTHYGPFELGELRPGQVEEIPAAAIQRLLSPHLHADVLPAKTARPQAPAASDLHRKRK